MLFECTALTPLGQQQADLFTPCTDTMCSFLPQQDHLGALNYIQRFNNGYRLSKCHEHKTLLPCLAQVISLLGWPKLVKFFFF